MWIVLYIICGLVSLWALLKQVNTEEDPTVLPTELVTAFLCWPVLCLAQIMIAVANMIYDKFESEDDDDLS